MPQPYYEDSAVTIYHGDCREILPTLNPVDLVLTDPPYGDTSLGWDRQVEGWLELLTTPQVWCFGSMRFWLATAMDFQERGWTYAQEIVWEKHNGSSFHADRFKRVHELALHWYRGVWGDLYHKVPVTADAARRTIRRKGLPAQHQGARGPSTYTSVDGGPRLMRSVLKVRSMHGSAEHPTQKPLGITYPLVEYSCPTGGTVLDPFMGSGTTLRAAKDLGRKAIGIEIEERYCEIAAKRMSQAVMEMPEVQPVPQTAAAF